MDKTKLDLTFSHQYDVDIIRELPSPLGKVKQLYFPNDSENRGRGGLLVKVTPYEGNPWIGIFAATYPSPKTVSGVFSCPNKHYLCVVSGGAGYYIQVSNPQIWKDIPIYPITDVHTLSQAQKIILVDFQGIAAYGHEGLLWNISNPAWDGIKVNAITHDEIKITVWNYHQQREVDLAIAIATGKYNDKPIVEWFSRPEMSTTYASPINQIIKLGERIQLQKSIKQPQNVFDWNTYKEFLNQRGSLEQEYKRLSSTMNRATAGAYLQQFREMRDEYISRLPLHLLAPCPYCKARVLQPVDSFSLASFYPLLNVADIYLGGSEWISSPRPRRLCRHALLATVSLNFNNLIPNDLPQWMLQRKWNWIASSPRIMVWPLIAQRTSAVIQTLPIGRLDDPELIHRYTAYFTTYFASDLSNLKTKGLWVSGDMGRPATEGVYYDPNLIKWVKAKRLFWLALDAPAHLVSGPENRFPYVDIQPQGRYRIIENGEVEGPHPYNPRFTWQGNAPHHNESFPQTIE